MRKHVNRVFMGFALLVLLSVVISRNFSASAPPSESKNKPSLGESVYNSRCVMCHGSDGKGNGLAAAFLHPRPRNFTTGVYKFRSTESGNLPTDDDLTRSIKQGLHGTSMPDWAPFLSDDTVKALIEYLKSFSPRFATEKPKPVKASYPTPIAPATIAAGKKVYEKLECKSCHGSDGAGTDAVATNLQDDWGYEIDATNLTEPWTFRGGLTPTDIYLRIRTGINGAPMPSYAGSANEKEMWNLTYYVLSLGRRPLWSMNADEVKRHFDKLDQDAKANPVARGKYLVKTMGCIDCHSPYTKEGYLMEELLMAGGLKWSIGPYGYLYSPNLTSDKETGIGNWKDEEIKRGITRGIRKDGSRSIPFPMPWTSYANLKEDDLNAIIAYLKTIPPIYNKIPEQESLNMFAYLWGKFKMLILKQDFASISYPGNAGTLKGANQ
ncbi:MAG: c-type cytochrome [Ignavibacteria bacterium]|nr:c-type cytochrome [Ignavibacteria bacterium]